MQGSGPFKQKRKTYSEVNVKRIFFVLIVALIGAKVFAISPQPMTLSEATTYAEQHWTVQQMAPLIQDLSILLFEQPLVMGPRMVSVLQKDGTLDVYWDSPDLKITWPDPNNKTQDLLGITVPLPTLHQPNFYKAPPSHTLEWAVGSFLVGAVAAAVTTAVLLK